MSCCQSRGSSTHRIRGIRGLLRLCDLASLLWHELILYQARHLLLQWLLQRWTRLLHRLLLHWLLHRLLLHWLLLHWLLLHWLLHWWLLHGLR